LRKTALCEAVLGQKKVKEAPATIVFAGNKHVKQNLEDVSRASVEAGVWSPEYARRVDMQVRLMLSDCPLVQSAKHTLLELVRPFAVVPSVPQTLEGYVWKQTALAAQQFMLAAAAHGLDTAPMEGLDEARVRQVVGLPRHFTIPLVVSVGYAKDEGAKSVRLDPQRVFFHETTS
jgi:nitroreductase